MEESPAALDRDRISELPQPLLHHILCFLSQKQAVQTCVLSKSWRYLGSTRPKLEFFHKKYYQHTFLSIVDKALQNYHDQNLCIKEFHVEIREYDSRSVLFLEKWFPFIVGTMSGVKTFDLSIDWTKSKYINLPSEFFENSKSLLNLRLCGLRFSKNPTDKVHLKYLHTLTLKDVHIVDQTFQKMISSCHYIEHVALSRCKGLTTIRLVNNSYLKRFDLFCFHEYRLKEDLCFVDVPNLESIKIEWGGNWFSFDHCSKMYFPGLKSLELTRLRLATRTSLDILSCDFPCLQHLHIHCCSGFGELWVSNSSIKHLVISHLDSSIKVVVDATNIVLLDYNSFLPVEISTTSSKCVSKIAPRFDVSSEDGFRQLSKLLNAVSQSKIYLDIPSYRNYYYHNSSDEDDNDNDNHDKPVLVEYLYLYNDVHHYFYSEAFLNRMFRYCRPRNILERRYCTWYSEFLCKMLLFRQNKGIPPYWQRDLEEVSMQVQDQNSGEWHFVEGTTFLESDFSNNYNGEVWFTLKWRE